MPDKFSVADEIDFWSRQLEEHALFMSLLIPEGTWKKDAERLRSEWAAFRQQSMDPVKRSEAAVKLAMRLRAYLMALHDAQSRGDWIGWAYPTFVDHVRREGDYFVERIANVDKEPETEELCRWLEFMQEHAEFAAHLLDPVERARVEQARKFVQAFMQVRRGCGHGVNKALVELSERAGRALDAYVGSIQPTTKSILHPALVEHVVREGRRFLEVAERIKVQVLKQQIALLKKS